MRVSCPPGGSFAASPVAARASSPTIATKDSKRRRVIHAARSTVLRCDQPLEGVVDVLHLLAGQRVDVRRCRTRVGRGRRPGRDRRAARQDEARGACQPEHPADLPLRGGPGVAARAEPQERRVVELHRLGCDALGEEHAAEARPLRARRSSASCASSSRMPCRSQIDCRRWSAGERVEQSERVERARHADGAVVDPRARERVLEHRQVEAGVVRDEHGAVEQLEQLGSDLGEARRGGNVLVADPVHRRCLGRDRTRGTNEPREPGGLDAVRIEPDDGERDDLVHDPASCRSSRSRTPRMRPAPARPPACARSRARHRYRPKWTCTNHVARAGRWSYGGSVDWRAVRVPIRACTCSSSTSPASSPSGASSRSAASSCATATGTTCATSGTRRSPRTAGRSTGR